VNTPCYICGVDKVNTPEGGNGMQIMIRGPEKVKEFLKKQADSIGITMNALVLIILQDWIQQKEREEQDGRAGSK
jgi:hypothetical protein